MKSTLKQLEPENTVKATIPQSGNGETSAQEVSPLLKAHNEIETSYTAHIEALKGFEGAFKNMARQDKVVYKEAERRFQAYRNAVELALKNRETVEKAAMTTYRNAVNKAVEAYRIAMQEALVECQQATEKAGALLTSLPGAENSTFHKYLRPIIQFWNSAKNVYKKISRNVSAWAQRMFDSIGLYISQWSRQTKDFFSKSQS